VSSLILWTIFCCYFIINFVWTSRTAAPDHFWFLPSTGITPVRTGIVSIQIVTSWITVSRIVTSRITVSRIATDRIVITPTIATRSCRCSVEDYLPLRPPRLTSWALAAETISWSLWPTEPSTPSSRGTAKESTGKFKFQRSSLSTSETILVVLLFWFWTHFRCFRFRCFGFRRFGGTR
jgi:hypothetical protein